MTQTDTTATKTALDKGRQALDDIKDLHPDSGHFGTDYMIARLRTAVEAIYTAVSAAGPDT